MLHLKAYELCGSLAGNVLLLQNKLKLRPGTTEIASAILIHLVEELIYNTKENIDVNLCSFSKDKKEKTKHHINVAYEI